jgi:hypothetical protein
LQHNAYAALLGLLTTTTTSSSSFQACIPAWTANQQQAVTALGVVIVLPLVCGDHAMQPSKGTQANIRGVMSMQTLWAVLTVALTALVVYSTS